MYWCSGSDPIGLRSRRELLRTGSSAGLRSTQARRAELISIFPRDCLLQVKRRDDLLRLAAFVLPRKYIGIQLRDQTGHIGVDRSIAVDGKGV